MEDQQPAQQDDQTVPAPAPVPAPADLPEPRRRHRVAAGVAAAALLLTAGGLGYAGAQRFDSGSGASASPSTQQGTLFGTDGRRRQLPGTPTDPDGDGDNAPSFRGGGSTSIDTGTTANATQLKGLVRIVSTLGFQNGKAAGTGMVLTSDGEVITNHHVVAGATKVTVTVMSTGKAYTANVVGTDAADDVAVLQLVGASGLTTVATNTTTPSVGDAVTAVGDANGTTDHLSAVAGQVTALHQSITTQDEGAATGERLTGLIEISNDVISGDSGGATYDAQGDVVGMTTAASRGGDIVGYAIPIAKVLRIAGNLENGVASSKYTYTRSAMLGVGLGRTDTTVAGAYSGTPAARAGITGGDTITSVDSTKVSTSAALRKAIAAHSPGDRVRISWTDASGSSHSATVTLATGPVS
jgi:S1-C subfamily serine protease